MWLCSNRTLSIDNEIWISCNFHISQNIFLLIFFFYLKVKTILNLQDIQKDSGLNLACGVFTFIDPCPRLSVRPQVLCHMSSKAGIWNASQRELLHYVSYSITQSRIISYVWDQSLSCYNQILYSKKLQGD